MQKIEPITIINVDDVPYAVSDMSDAVKSLVEFYNDWRIEEAEIKADLLKLQSAQRDLSREIITTIRREKEQKEMEEAAIREAQEKEAANEIEAESTPEANTDA